MCLKKKVFILSLVSLRHSIKTSFQNPRENVSKVDRFFFPRIRAKIDLWEAHAT